MDALNGNLELSGAEAAELRGLTRRLREHVVNGFEVPDSSVLSAIRGAPIMTVLRVLDEECAKIRRSAEESDASES